MFDFSVLLTLKKVPSEMPYRLDDLLKNKLYSVPRKENFIDKSFKKNS